MTTAPIDQGKLAVAVRTRRADLSLRAAEEESGVSFNVIQRVERQETTPDLKNFIRLCRWMRMPMDFFVTLDTEQPAAAA